MRYIQITPGERYTLGLLRKQGFSNAEIGRLTGRHRSSIGREFERNYSHYDGAYRHSIALSSSLNCNTGVSRSYTT